MIRFGPAGNSDSFYDQGYKSSVQMPRWLSGMGLNAYEYQCGKGVKIGEKIAREIGQQAKENDIFLSIHAPYYINLANADKEKRQKSVSYIIDTLQAAKLMDARRIVVHTGSVSGSDRAQATATATNALSEAIKQADDLGYSDIVICPEVLGKINQLGTLDEILEMCSIDERLIPTVDFGHLHARGLGSMNSPEDFEKVLDRIESILGKERLRILHCHFSRIEFTAGGEKKHWSFKDNQYGPEFEHLAQMIVKKEMEPVIICESRGNMAEDALVMKHIYERTVNTYKK